MTSIALIWYFSSIHLFFFLLMPQNLVLGSNPSLQENIKCIEKERLALLSFKQRLMDEYDILSSWETRVRNDCCNWRGVQCSNSTSHHIIKLDLRGSYGNYLKGEVGSSLTQLSHLNYLDLSYNLFNGTLLEDIDSLINLNYLNLSYNRFASVIPHLGNLSKLSVLDLGVNYELDHDNFRWLSSFSSLKHLDLSWVNFRGANDWAIAINQLPMLQSLSLSHCNVSQPILPSHSNTNFSRFLVELDLSSNYNLNSSIYYSWLINFTNLVHLNLKENMLSGTILQNLGQLSNLKELDLSYNMLGGTIPQNLGQLTNLKELDLSSNMLSGTIPQIFGQLSNLKELDLSYNMLGGTIPRNLGQLSDLEILRLGYNLLEGEVSKTHFSKLTHLKVLHLSNTCLNLNLFRSDWIPPFQLEGIYLSYCKLGPVFPKWFQTQNFSNIHISFAEISDFIPHSFWNSLSPNLWSIDLSGNKMMGEIPDLSMKFKRLFYIDLGSNKFVGRIPSFLFQAPDLYVSNNNFSDLTSLCEIVNSSLRQLDLSNNQLSGQLPDCWDSLPNLAFLNLSNNYFSGHLPHSMSNLIQLENLILRNNQFSGGLHHLFNLTFLNVIDAMNNNFSGTIPSSIGSNLQNLGVLDLKANNFEGNLPSSLCNLRNIIVLDISSNNLSGSIPTCIRNFNVFRETSQSFGSEFLNYLGYSTIVWKGQERFIDRGILPFERIIDLSCNHLTGKIPIEITELVGLIALNLSNNELTGQIPYNMGQLQSLESLDLSRNRLSGRIPSSFSQISRLAVLDLSYNNFSGRIPTGTQLQGFNISSYEGNPYLCGDPLKKCFEKVTLKPNINNAHVENENEDRPVLREFFMSMTFGYIVGFWGIFGSLVFHRRWRHAYFKFLGKIIN